jgi:hypothetical protein
LLQWQKFEPARRHDDGVAGLAVVMWPSQPLAARK